MDLIYFYLKKANIKLLQIIIAMLMLILTGCNSIYSNNTPVDNNSSSEDLKNAGMVSILDVGNCKKILVKGDKSFILDGINGLKIINIMDRHNPFIENRLGTPEPADLCIVDDIVYIADYNRGLVAVNISDTGDLKIVNEINKPNQSLSICCDNDHLFFTSQYTYNEKKYSNFIIYSIKSRENPEKIGEYPGLPWLNDITVEEDYAYLAFIDSDKDETGMIIIDITDLEKPEFTSYFKTSGFARSIVVENDYAFIADGRSGLKIVDISSRWEPFLAGSVETKGRISDLFLEDDFLYIADGYNGIGKIDIMDTGNPEMINSVRTMGFADGLYVSGEFIYVADGKYFTILDKF